MNQEEPGAHPKALAWACVVDFLASGSVWPRGPQNAGIPSQAEPPSSQRVVLPRPELDAVTLISLCNVEIQRLDVLLLKAKDEAIYEGCRFNQIFIGTLGERKTARELWGEVCENCQKA